ncbi:Ltp family lipoprotein [Oceanobacillus chungangensis]|nr:Ltp family lipoprotein [Oceanobacillus chungangensis]
MARAAVLIAQGYLDYSSFSRSGLIEQQEFEGFSNEEGI